MKKWERSAAERTMTFNHRQSTTVPIRDLHNDGRIVFLVDIYGWTGADVCAIPSGSDPLVKAVQRLGLDPDRYQAVLWDVQL